MGDLVAATEVTCHYCHRPGQVLARCCDHHPGRLVCADVASCRDVLLALVQEQEVSR